MIRLGFVFLGVAVVAALLGFLALTGAASLLAKAGALIFLILFIVSVAFGRRNVI